MSVESPNPDRLLLFGRDANLLETRAMVLRSAGMTVDVAVDIGAFKGRITAPGSIYDVVVCCYTATTAECNEIIPIANRTRTSLLMLEHLLSPQALIDQVSNLIKDGRSRLDDAD